MLCVKNSHREYTVIRYTAVSTVICVFAFLFITKSGPGVVDEVQASLELELDACPCLAAVFELMGLLGSDQGRI